MKTLNINQEKQKKGESVHYRLSHIVVTYDADHSGGTSLVEFCLLLSCYVLREETLLTQCCTADEKGNS